jgi:predicted RNA binding protein YcfA (HicA-like mRNA interferase family)
MSRLYSSQHILKVLQKKGFIQVGQKGSHKKLRKGEKAVIVPDPRKEVPMGTFYSILRQPRLRKEDFE